MLLCAQYVVPVTSDPIKNGAILVEDGKIADIGLADLMRLRYPEEEVIDFGQAAITPGFIDLHARTEDAVFRGMLPDLPFASWMNSITCLRSKLSSWEDRRVSAYLGGLDSISAGVTTISDMTTTGANAYAANELGLRGVFHRKTSAVNKKLVNYAIKKTDSDLEKWSSEVDTSRISFGVAAAPTYQCHPAMYRELARYATANGDLPLELTLAGSDEEYRFVKYGATFGGKEVPALEGYMEVPPWLPTAATPVNYVLNWGLFEAKNITVIHCVHVNDEDISKLKQYDVAVALCPTFTSQLGMGLAPADEFLRAGLRVGIGTEAPCSLDFQDIFSEMRVQMLSSRSSRGGNFVSAQTMLEMGTIRAAEVLRMDDKIGSLEVGKLADIVAIELSGTSAGPHTSPASAIVGSAVSNDVLMTMVGGNILYERGKWNVGGSVVKNIAQILEIRSRLSV